MINKSRLILDKENFSLQFIRNMFFPAWKCVNELSDSAVFSGGSEKGLSLISAYRSLAITTNTPGFKKLYTALSG